MNQLLKTIKARAESELVMSPPKKELLIVLAWMQLFLFCLITASVSILLIATIPLLVYWLYGYVWICKMWKKFGYPVLLAIVVAVVAFLTGGIIRDGIHTLTTIIL